MELNVINESKDPRWTRYRTDFIAISEKVQSELSLEDNLCVAVVFVTPEAIREINREYRQIDKPTDVISFALRDSEDTYELNDGVNELGDIFINIKAIRVQAQEYGHSLRREVCFLFTHGLLHLLGYDHISEKEERVMFVLQEAILHDIVPKKVRS